MRPGLWRWGARLLLLLLLLFVLLGRLLPARPSALAEVWCADPVWTDEAEIGVTSANCATPEGAPVRVVIID